MYSGSYYTVCFKRKYVVKFFSNLNSCIGSFQMHCIVQNIYMYISAP